MSMRGVQMLTHVPHTLEVLQSVKDPLDSPEEEEQRRQEYSERLEHAKEDAEFANKELTTGFPLLHAHTLVGLWGALEAAVQDCVLGMLLNEPDLLRAERFAKCRIPLAEFELLDKEERIRLLIEEVSRQAQPTRGAGAFEAILGLVDLGGSIDQQTKKTLWEMYHIRNVIVHRASLADRRLMESCPWLNLKVNNSVTISHDAHRRYYDAAGEYLMTVIRRLGVRYNVDIDKKIAAAAVEHRPSENRRTSSAAGEPAE